MLQLIITPVLSRFVFARPFSVPQVENEVKRLHFAVVAEIQESVTDELKKVQKQEFSVALQIPYDRSKACIYAMEFNLNKKKLCLPHVSSILKKINSKTFGPHCVSNILVERKVRSGDSNGRRK
jgi:hypothetical protein